MRKWLILTAVLALCLAGCGKAEEPVRQLFFPEVPVLGQTMTVPAWFYPETGEMAYLCPDCPHQCMGGESACKEEVHGEKCLFYKFDGRSYHLVGDKLYYLLAEDLYMYDTGIGESVRLIDKGDGWSYIFKGEYLYRYDRNSAWENGYGYNSIERIHLPDMKVTDISGQNIPIRIVDNTAYYVVADSNPHIVSGLYRQPLYAEGEEPPAKELLLYGVELGIGSEITEEAVYWVGSDRLREEPEEITHHLYRYDFEKQTTILVAEDFSCGKLVSDGEYLYAVRHREDGYALIRTDDYGNITVLGTAEAGQRLLTASVDMAGPYVIADMADTADGTTQTGKMVYDTRTGEVQVYWLQGRDT